MKRIKPKPSTTPSVARPSRTRVVAAAATRTKAVATTKNTNYSGPNRKRKPDNTVAAIQHPAKGNSKKNSGGFKDLLKEKCPWHTNGNHTTKQCYQLRHVSVRNMVPTLTSR
jgi:hypothetical protein